MNKRANRFQNPWTEEEKENLRPFISMPISVAAADPAVRKIVNIRGKGAVAQRLYKLRGQEATNGNGHKPRKATLLPVKRRKAKPAPAPTPTTGTPLNYCPNCGCGLLAVRAALTL